MTTSPKTPINDYTLIDSERRSQTRPDTWAHPDNEALQRIEVGYMIKVGLTHPTLSGERFWGLVKERTGRGFLLQVDQDMSYAALHGISDKDILFVTEGNIFGIIDEGGAMVWEAK